MIRPFALAVAIASLATAISAQDTQRGANPAQPPADSIVPVGQQPVQLFPPPAAGTQVAPAGITVGATAFTAIGIPAILGAIVVGAVVLGGSSSDTQ